MNLRFNLVLITLVVMLGFPLSSGATDESQTRYVEAILDCERKLEKDPINKPILKKMIKLYERMRQDEITEDLSIASPKETLVEEERSIPPDLPEMVPGELRNRPAQRQKTT